MRYRKREGIISTEKGKEKFSAFAYQKKKKKYSLMQKYKTRNTHRH